MRYPAKFKPDGHYLMVTFPDIPEAITQGDDEADAARQALDALETALDFYFEDGRPIPAPSPRKRGQRWIELPLSTVGAILLHNELVRQKVNRAELAERLNIPLQKAIRIFKLRHKTDLDTIATALNALGKHLEVSLV